MATYPFYLNDSVIQKRTKPESNKTGRYNRFLIGKKEKHICCPPVCNIIIFKGQLSTGLLQLWKLTEFDIFQYLFQVFMIAERLTEKAIFTLTNILYICNL